MKEKRLVRPNHKRDLCACGNPKDARSKQCRDCWSRGKKSLPRDACPQCGQPKAVTSELCYQCSHPTEELREMKGIRQTDYDIPALDRDWLLQFTGFFMADGSISSRFRSDRGRAPRPSMVINLRADSRPWLEEIVSKLGGKLYEYDPGASPGSKPQCRWFAGGFTRCLPIIKAMLGVCTIPCRKVEELKIAKEWCEWRTAWGNRLGPEGHRINEEYAKRLSEAKIFNVP